MSLLSAKQKRQIRDAMRMVTDTFMVTPVMYHLRRSKADRWSEGTSDYFEDIPLNFLVEYKTKDSAESLEGFEADFDVTLTINVENLIELGLYDVITNNHKLSSTDDFFTAKGVKYKVTYIGFDGPLDRQDILLIIKGLREEEK